MEKELEEIGWRGFVEQCLKVEATEDLEAFFELFLTSGEREEIAARFLIVRELLKGDKPQREIARSIGVSIANVSRGANVLKTMKDRLKKFLG